MWGNYREALDHVYVCRRYPLSAKDETDLIRCRVRAYQDSKWRWGIDHPTTMQCESFHALLVALDSRDEEGVRACKSSYNALKEKLGPHHPNTIHALGNVVQAYGAMSKLVLAVDTGRAYASISELHLEPHHPETMRSKCLLAEILMAKGEYASAEHEIRLALDTSERLNGPNNHSR